MRRLATAVLGFTATALLGAAVVVGVSACKQDESEYCQIDHDCASGLTCVRATNTCQRPGSTGIDGGEVDAAVDARIDGPPDAPPDAAIDASIDAP